MIFGSIGLLIAAGGLLAAGISESSTGFLVASLIATVAAGALLLLAYAASRAAQGAQGPATWPLRGSPPPNTPGVVYVPLALTDEQLAALRQLEAAGQADTPVDGVKKAPRRSSRSRR